MSWISKNLTLDLIAIAIHGMQSAFDRIKSEPESDWPPAEVPQQAPAAVEQPAPAPQQQEQPAAPAPEPAPTPEPAAAPETAPQPAPTPETPQQVDRLPEAQAHLRDISLGGGMDWITQTLFPQFGVQNLNDIPADQLPQLIEQATAYKLEKGLG